MKLSPNIKELKGREGAVLFIARSVKNTRVPFEAEVRLICKNGSTRQLTSDEAGGVSGGRTPAEALREAEMLFRIKYLSKAR
jgi:hypothetical protein